MFTYQLIVQLIYEVANEYLSIPIHTYMRKIEVSILDFKITSKEIVNKINR